MNLDASWIRGYLKSNGVGGIPATRSTNFIDTSISGSTKTCVNQPRGNLWPAPSPQ